MKKAVFIILFTVIGFLQPLEAQTFKASFSFNPTDRKLSFFVRPIGGNITSAIGYFEFTVRHAAGSGVTFGAITNNTGVFPGLNMVPGAGAYGGAQLQRFNFTSTIPSQTYLQNADLLVFSVVLGGSGMPNLDLITNYVAGDPTFAVTDGGGNQLWDPANAAIFYPSQTTSSNDIFYRLAVALPLDLTAFSARAAEKTIDLFWKTENEHGFEGFDIERSEDGFRFEKIGFEKGKGASGPADYSFSDGSVERGRDYFYRLKMLDADGHFSFSNIEKARLEATAPAVKIWPNPVADFLKIEKGEGHAADFFEIVDASGRTVSAGFLAEKGPTEIEVAGLPDGPFVLRLFDGKTEAGAFRFIKNR